MKWPWRAYEACGCTIAVLIDLSLDYLGQLMARNADIPLGLGA